MPRTKAHEKHQTPTKSGTLAHIRIKGTLYRRHFKRGTDPIRIREWLLKTEMAARRATPTRTGRFADDAAVYLEAVKAMPTYADRATHIEEWIEVFEDQPRDEITADQIRAQLNRWRTESRDVVYTRRPTPKDKKHGPVVLSASAVNKRRTALMHLFTVLDGKSERNPVRDAPKFREPAPAPRGIPFPLIAQMFKAMAPSKSKARLMVIAYTGIPHAQIKTLTAEDVDTDARTALVAGRGKGKGTRGRVVPLTADGIQALKAMAREEAWGSFSNAMLRLALRRAMKAIDPARAATITTYDLRHSFGTEVYRRSGDIRATQLLMDHSTPVLTHRYTLAAQDSRVTAAITAWAGESSARSSKKKKKAKKKAR